MSSPRRVLVSLAVTTLSSLACGGTGGLATTMSTAQRVPADDPTMTERRVRMVTSQIEARGVSDPRVLAALRRVPRHLFVPPELQDDAYDDGPLPIGSRQTISQPYIVAYMSELLRVGPKHKVLEVGTGSGYQAAVLAELTPRVYSIELLPELSQRAEHALRSAGYDTVRLRIGDGYDGWKEEAPFDRIIVTAAPEQVPAALVDQLAEDGRLVLPVGSAEQWIRVITKSEGRTHEQTLLPVRFVPMVRSKPGE